MFKSVLMFSIFAITCVQAGASSSSPALTFRDRFRAAGVTPLSKEDPHKESKKVVELGRLLFFDKILSGNGDISCATCHHGSLGSTDNLPLPIGSGGKGLGPKRSLELGHLIPRNAPAAFNLGYKSFHTTMWDGRISIDPIKGWLKTPEPMINGESPLESALVKQIKTVAAAQALFPVTSHHEMRGLKGQNDIADATNNIEVWKKLVERLIGKSDGSMGGIHQYKKLFLEAFSSVNSLDEINFGHVARAIAAFEIYAFDASTTRFDKFLEGDRDVLTLEEIEGAKIFSGKGKCLTCHSGPHLTDFKFYSLCAPQLGPGKEPVGENAEIGEDKGLAGLTDKKSDLYKFKTPTLRNVELTGPWLHAGTYDKLEDVIYQHINPRETMNSFLADPNRYLKSVADSVFDYSDFVDHSIERNEARLGTLAEELRGVKLDENELSNLVAFLKTLTDRSFKNRAFPPSTVPSGLPVED